MDNKTGGHVTNPNDVRSEAPTSWTSEVNLASWNVTADESIPEFLGRVAHNLGFSRSHIRSHNSGAHTFVFLSLPECPDEVMLQVRHHRGTGRLVANLLGRSFPSEKRALIRKWRAAIDKALQDGSSPQISKWRAKLIIGESTQLSSGPYKLSGPGNIGPFEIAPSSGPMWVRHESPFMEGFSIKTVWPIDVWSEGPLNRWQTPRTPTELKDLCLVLAVATGHHWGVRGQLVPRSEVPAPERELAQLRENWEEYGTPEPEPDTRDEFSIEPWMESALAVLKRQPLLRDAVAMFDQGLIIGVEQPSVAALCFTSTIEAVGKLAGDELPRCPECGSRTGVTKRFKEQVAKVVPEEDVKRYGNLYAKRSETTHESALHGDELKPTLFDTSFDPFGKNLNYLGSVITLRETTRTILQQTLQDSAENGS